MITVLQRDLGVRYNEAKIHEHVPLDVEDRFVHGILQGHGGTCASMPVLYAAVGRRLGYPIKLVAAKGESWMHLFCRWDEPGGERFNVEGTNRGLSCHPDDYYRTGPYAPTAKYERECGLLRSMTPREELAGFLAQRGFCWKDTGDFWREAVAFAWSLALAPHNRGTEERLRASLNDWTVHMKRLSPRNFPVLYCHWPEERLLPAGVPLDVDQGIQGLSAWQTILLNPEHDRRWWGPLRRGLVPSPCPAWIDVYFTPSGFTVKFGYRGTELLARGYRPQPYTAWA
jgi:hypothetical protein